MELAHVRVRRGPVPRVHLLGYAALRLRLRARAVAGGGRPVLVAGGARRPAEPADGAEAVDWYGYLPT